MACRVCSRSASGSSVGRVLVAAVVVDPSIHDLRRHLGMELDRPRRVADPAGLKTDVAVGERHGARRQRELVAVPLEGLEAPAAAGPATGRRQPRRRGAPRASRSRAGCARRGRAPAASATSCAPRHTPAAARAARAARATAPSPAAARDGGPPGRRSSLRRRPSRRRSRPGHRGGVSVSARSQQSSSTPCCSSVSANTPGPASR